MMPLAMTAAGETSRIVRITGKDSVRQHLNELGFVPGEEVSVVSELAGNMIISLKSSRIALDKAMANRILVE